MKDNNINQAECFKNTQALPQRVKAFAVSGFAGVRLCYSMKARLYFIYEHYITIKPPHKSAFKRFSQSPSLIPVAFRKAYFYCLIGSGFNRRIRD